MWVLNSEERCSIAPEHSCNVYVIVSFPSLSARSRRGGLVLGQREVYDPEISRDQLDTLMMTWYMHYCFASPSKLFSSHGSKLSFKWRGSAATEKLPSSSAIHRIKAYMSFLPSASQAVSRILCDQTILEAPPHDPAALRCIVPKSSGRWAVCCSHLFPCKCALSASTHVPYLHVNQKVHSLSLQYLLCRIAEWLTARQVQVTHRILSCVEEAAKLEILNTARAFLATIDASAQMASDLKGAEVHFPVVWQVRSI